MSRGLSDQASESLEIHGITPDGAVRFQSISPLTMKALDKAAMNLAKELASHGFVGFPTRFSHEDFTQPILTWCRRPRHPIR